MQFNENEQNKEGIKNIIELAMEKIKSIGSCDVVVGSPIQTQSGVIVPVCKVVLGFALGGGEMKGSLAQKKQPINYPVSVATGGGVNITPVGFIVDANGEISFLNISSPCDNVEKIISLLTKMCKFAEGVNKKHEKS